MVDQALADAGLCFSSDNDPGIRRKRSGRGFSYVDENGVRIEDESVLQRIRSLAIPPAYKEVWICTKANGHLQATGIDARGRKQYRYHPDWRAVRDADKFARLCDFGRALTRIRKRVSADLKLPGLARDRVIATVVRLLDRTSIRIGNEQYARENKSYGLTTLRTRHVRLRGNLIQFEFRGKSGVLHSISVTDPLAAEVVRGCLDLPGQELFQYLDDTGARRTVTSSDVNAYLCAAGGQDFSAKDFRTWYATMDALEMLSALQFETQREAKAHIKESLHRIAQRLGNTPTMCRKAYVHPGVLQAFMEGRLSSVVRAGRRNKREQLLQLLQDLSRGASRLAKQPKKTRSSARPAVPKARAFNLSQVKEQIWL
ncbi:MAG TPA: DNA topoisomerase IB [Burkholderiales bacterium]|nr:DNA topoisomerase IB [Burkholderiales bacterium]